MIIIKKLLQKSGFTFIFLITILSQVSTQNVGINTDQPEAALHIRSNATQNLFVDFEDQTSGDLQIINGPWFYNNISYEGNYSTNSGYLANGQRLMQYTIDVPMDSFAIFSYYVKVDIQVNGEYSLPFEDTITGPIDTDWAQKKTRFDSGTHIAEWYVGNTQNPNAAGLIYVDNVKLTFYPIKPVLILESGNEGEGKVLTSNENGSAS